MLTSFLRWIIDYSFSAQLCNCVFLKSIFDLIENNGEDEELVLTLIKFILSLNLRFDHPHENPIMLTLLAVNEQLSCRELIERLILLFNRSGKTNQPELHCLFHHLIVFFRRNSWSDWMQNNEFSNQVFHRFIWWSSNYQWCTSIRFRPPVNRGNHQPRIIRSLDQRWSKFFSETN